MTEISYLQDRLSATSAAIHEITKHLAEYPNSDGVLLMRRSLENRYALLENRILKELSRSGMDVCTYRSFSEGVFLAAATAFSAIADFQTLFSVTYAAEKHGAKQTAKIGQSTVNETSFGFGYAFSGSIGVVLTLPNERLLGCETVIDAAMHNVFQLIRADDPNDVKKLSSRLGIPPIKALYNWAEKNTKNGVNAFIDWRRGTKTRDEITISQSRFSRLTEIIEQTSDVETTVFTVSGSLDAIDHTHRRFKLTSPAGEISGRYTDDLIGPDHKVEVPGKVFIVELRKETRIVYSTGTEETEFHLLKLTPSDQTTWPIPSFRSPDKTSGSTHGQEGGK